MKVPKGGGEGAAREVEGGAWSCEETREGVHLSPGAGQGPAGGGGVSDHSQFQKLLLQYFRET